MTLHALGGGSKQRELTGEECAKGPVRIDCTGPTIWSFDCSQPH